MGTKALFNLMSAVCLLSTPIFATVNDDSIINEDIKKIKIKNGVCKIKVKSGKCKIKVRNGESAYADSQIENNDEITMQLLNAGCDPSILAACGYSLAPADVPYEAPQQQDPIQGPQQDPIQGPR